jgi:hypothetical protein
VTCRCLRSSDQHFDLFAVQSLVGLRSAESGTAGNLIHKFNAETETVDLEFRIGRLHFAYGGSAIPPYGKKSGIFNACRANPVVGYPIVEAVG